MGTRDAPAIVGLIVEGASVGAMQGSPQNRKCPGTSVPFPNVLVAQNGLVPGIEAQSV